MYMCFMKQWWRYDFQLMGSTLPEVLTFRINNTLTGLFLNIFTTLLNIDRFENHHQKIDGFDRAPSDDSTKFLYWFCQEIDGFLNPLLTP